MNIQFNNWQQIDLVNLNNGFNAAIVEFETLFSAFDSDFIQNEVDTNTRITGIWNGFNVDLRGNHFIDDVPISTVNSISLTSPTTNLNVSGSVTYDFNSGTFSGSYSNISYTSTNADVKIVGQFNVDIFGDLAGGSASEYNMKFNGYTVNYVGNMILDVNGDIVGGTISSFTFIDNVGRKLTASGMSLNAADFDSFTDSTIHTNLNDFYAFLTSSSNLAGNDTLAANASDISSNLINGFAGNDSLTGGAGSDTLNGGAGNDTLNGGAGNDTMNGGLGNDIYVVSEVGDVVTEGLNQGYDGVYASISNTLADNVELLVLTGSANIQGTGNGLNNILIGNTGSNMLNGGAGNDTMQGGLGNDVYVVTEVGDVVTEALNAGYDSVYTNINHTLAANLESVVLFGNANINATGNGLNNILTGNAGNNTLNGGAGNDTMIGGLGNDIYVVSEVGDVVTEGLNQGYDGVYASISNTLADNVELLVLTGSANNQGTGNGLNNILIGNTGSNMLNGGAGNDTMQGGLGNDVYVVTEVGDVVTEALNAGYDSVYTNINHTLAANLESVVLFGNANINATGNGLNNILTGNAGNNTLNGGAGNDTMIGGLGADVFVFNSLGISNIDNINDFTSSQDKIQLTGEAFSALSGGIYTDMFALAASAQDANDYLIYNKATGDLYYDADGNGAGAQQLFTNLKPNKTLAQSDFVGALTTAQYGINNLVLTGTSGNDNLVGGAGDDSIFGNEGNDIINGGDGNDILDGGLSGDIYIFNRGSEHNVAEIFDSGINGIIFGAPGDRVYFTSTLQGDSLTLYAGDIGIESINISETDTLPITGSTALNVDASAAILSQLSYMAGNNGANTIIGNAQNNAIYGYGGNDTLFGGSGDDELYATDGNLLSLSSGTESNVLYGGDGRDFLWGSGGNELFSGDEGNDSISAGGGVDTISGGAGNNQLTGGIGADIFILDSAIGLLNSVNTGYINYDLITDFSSGSDKIHLSQGVFTSLTFGTLNTADFVNSSTGVAQDSTDHILYDNSGTLYYDADGNGGVAAVQFASLTGTPTLVASDFFIV